jgi:hypothetical protein
MTTWRLRFVSVAWYTFHPTDTDTGHDVIRAETGAVRERHREVGHSASP